MHEVASTVPTIEQVAKYAELMGADDHSRRVLLDARRQLDDAAPSVHEAIASVAHQISSGFNHIGAPDPIASALPAETGLAGRFADVMALLACVPQLLAFHESRGIPAEQSWAVLADLPQHMRLFRRTHGVDGFSELRWLSFHLRGLLYDMGRLQMERARGVLVPDDQTALVAAGGGVTDDEVLLSVHIPESGPMRPDDCEASYRRALVDLATWFPEEQRRGFVCLSWLLDPQLADYLPASSNIVQFQRRYELVGPGMAASFSVLWFVFGRVGDVDLDSLPQNTTLERICVQHLRDGGEWYVRTGWFPSS